MLYDLDLHYIVAGNLTDTGEAVPKAPAKTRRDIIHERIGYNPEPIAGSPSIPPPVQQLFQTR